MGTNHSSGAERSMCNKFGESFFFIISNKACILEWQIFVCVTSIGVKSKYGSCRGTCMGFIKINNKQYVEIHIKSIKWNNCLLYK
jgi:hypothetical protein